MEDILLNVKALAALQNMTIEELAKACDIEPSHLRNVQNGRATMTARDLKQLSKFTGVLAINIQE